MNEPRRKWRPAGAGTKFYLLKLPVFTHRVEDKLKSSEKASRYNVFQPYIIKPTAPIKPKPRQKFEILMLHCIFNYFLSASLIEGTRLPAGTHVAYSLQECYGRWIAIGVCDKRN